MSISKYNSEGYVDTTPYKALTDTSENTNNSRPYRPMVFICSPYAGDVENNTLKAREYCRFAVSEGMIPVAPHLLYPQFMDDSVAEQRELGMFFGLVLLTKCTELWVFGDEITNGMKREIKKAHHRDMKIRYYTESCEMVSRD